MNEAAQDEGERLRRGHAGEEYVRNAYNWDLISSPFIEKVRSLAHEKSMPASK